MEQCAFHRKTLEIVIRDEKGRQMYELDLERCTTPASLLDGILQVTGKTWCTASMTKDLLRELDRACREVFGRGAQGTFCAFGQNKRVDCRKRVIS